jgi:hypothetical protein
MMEAARTSETSVDNYFTWQYIPEDKSDLFVLLESTHVKAPDSSENGKWIKMDLTRSSPGPFIFFQLYQ